MKKKITANKAIKTVALFSVAATLGLTSCKKKCEDVSAINYDQEGECQYDNSGNVVITNNISTNTTWTNDNVYELSGRITVLSGATLTIEPGTIIKGQSGTGAQASTLLVARGGQLIACGTATMPIIFTSVSDQISIADVAAGNFESPNLTAAQKGLWGGVIILGNARISAPGNATEIQIEGIPTSDTNGLYGGTDDTDNSGQLCYVSIRHGGTNIGSGNEINGLTLGGVGSQTQISNIEIVGNQDDGIEWFGGTVNVSNIVVWDCGDDALDTDQAWNGTASNFFVINPAGSAMELDGPEGTYVNGNHTITNGIVSPGANMADHLIDVDSASTNVDISNVYFKDLTNSANKVADYLDWSNASIGAITNIEYTFVDSVANGLTEAGIFVDMPASITTHVLSGQNTHGPAASSFTWTWAYQAGQL